MPVVALDLRISPQMLKRIEVNLTLFSGVWGKMIHEKNLQQNPVTGTSTYLYSISKEANNEK
jgi:hypothetical protein